MSDRLPLGPRDLERAERAARSYLVQITPPPAGGTIKLQITTQPNQSAKGAKQNEATK